jgi:hypothetical protein
MGEWMYVNTWLKSRFCWILLKLIEIMILVRLIFYVTSTSQRSMTPLCEHKEIHLQDAPTNYITNQCNSMLNTICKDVAFEALIAMTMKSSVFWDITPCSPVKLNKRLLPCCLLHASFSLGLLSDPDDGGDMFLRNVGWLSPHYTALYPRRQNSSSL